MREIIIDDIEQIETTKDSNNPVVSKKKRKITPIILILILTVIVIGIVVFSFITSKTLDGAWELVENPEIEKSTSDEVKDSDRVYYTFSKSTDYGNGTYKTYFNGGVEEGEYKLSKKNGKKLINLGTKDLEFKITGSRIFGNAKLTIIYPEYTDEQTGEKHSAENYIFVQAKNPKYEEQSYSKFEIDNSLINKWITNERNLSYYGYELSYTETVEFFDNGIMTIHYYSDDLAVDRYMYYAYTTKDNNLTFSLITDKETKYTVDYQFDNKGNLKFTDDTTEASIFADAFFSDFTYYKSENLPSSKDTNAEIPTKK